MFSARIKPSHRILFRTSVKNPSLAQGTSEWSKKKLPSYNRKFRSNAGSILRRDQYLRQVAVYHFVYQTSFCASFHYCERHNLQTTEHNYLVTDLISNSDLYCYTFCKFIFCSGTNLHPFWADNCFPLFLFSCWLSSHDFVWRRSFGFIENQLKHIALQSPASSISWSNTALCCKFNFLNQAVTRPYLLFFQNRDSLSWESTFCTKSKIFFSDGQQTLAKDWYLAGTVPKL